MAKIIVKSYNTFVHSNRTQIWLIKLHSRKPWTTLMQMIFNRLPTVNTSLNSILLTSNHTVIWVAVPQWVKLHQVIILGQRSSSMQVFLKTVKFLWPKFQLKKISRIFKKSTLTICKSKWSRESSLTWKTMEKVSKDYLWLKTFSRILRPSRSNSRVSVPVMTSSCRFNLQRKIKNRWAWWKTSSFKLSTRVRVKFLNINKLTNLKEKEGKRRKPNLKRKLSRWINWVRRAFRIFRKSKKISMNVRKLTKLNSLSKKIKYRSYNSFLSNNNKWEL